MKPKQATLKIDCYTYIFNAESITDGTWRLKRATVRRLFRIREKAGLEFVEYAKSFNVNDTAYEFEVRGGVGGSVSLGCRHFNHQALRRIREWAFADTKPKAKRKPKT